MNAHLRANLWLLGLTVLLCCVLYPLTLWAVGRVVFPDKSAGSLIDKDGLSTVDDGKAVGSRLIGQSFNGPEFFQPRPSSPSYDASASGGSNLSANNPKLRARVAQTLGPIVKYRSGPKKDQLVGPDIELWVAQHRTEEAGNRSNIPANFFDVWLQAHPDVELVEVPADMVMSSASGLDPHITLKNARYQLDRVADAWTKKTRAAPVRVREAIEYILNRNVEKPFGGLAGVELINVLDVNRALPSAKEELKLD